MKTRIFSLTLLIIIISLFQVQTTFAGSWTTWCSGLKVQGNSYGCGGKRVSKPSSSLWLAEISSYTSPGITIPVGWTYWTSRERCNGAISQQVVHGGRSVSTSYTYDYQYMTILPCSSTRTGQVLGKHEVKGNLFVWRYDWTQSETIP